MTAVDVDRKAAWLSGDSVVRAILQEGMQQYAKRVHHLAEVFRLGDLIVVCIDGRIHGAICLAGSGIKLGLEGAVKFCREVERLYGKIEAVSWHRDCGAAAAYAKEHGGSADECAKRFAKDLAEALGVQVIKLENGGASGFHPERVVYYDGTGRFDGSRSDDLPVGFTVSRAYLDFDVEYAKDELGIAFDIALKSHLEGGHGFGEMFDAQHPFLVIVVAKDAKQLVKLTAEAQDAVERLPEEDHKRVRVDGFIHEIV